MKKIILLVIAFVVILCSCSLKEYDIDICVLMDEILASQTFEDEMMIITHSDEENRYIIDQIIGDDYAEAIMAFPKEGISCDLIIIVKAADESDSAMIRRQLADFLVEREEAYLGYAPLEAQKIEDNAVFNTFGSYEILSVLPDPNTAQEWISKAFLDK